jgi:leucine dehydrogenase
VAVFDADGFEHEQVVFLRDAETGLRAIVAIHDTSRGPAVGGCRMWPYADDAQALRDALRLSRGMSFKSAVAGLALGGGKAVLIGDPRRDKSPELLRAFARGVESLGGRFVAAEDVGISLSDVECMARTTRHVAGLSRERGASGDPSPLTALGVLAGLRAAVVHRLARGELAGLRVAVQGVGAVGAELCRLLAAEGARLVVADVDAAAARRAAAASGARLVAPQAVYDADVDVFAPCALGAVLDHRTIPRLRAGLVVGSANNQLASPDCGDALHARGVLYAPDFVVNAGGIVNIACELGGCYDPDEALERVAAIGPRLARLLAEADAKGEPPARVADRWAREALARGAAVAVASAAG